MFARIIALLVGLGFGGTLAQGPEFVQQYSQRLGGRLDELGRFVRQFDDDAGRFGLSRSAALDEFQKPGSAFINRRGVDAAVTIARFERYRQHKAELDGAGPFERLVEFARDYEPDIASATLGDYRPAVPVTTEGLGLGAFGFVAGLVLCALLGALFRSPRRRRISDEEARLGSG